MPVRRTWLPKVLSSLLLAACGPCHRTPYPLLTDGKTDTAVGASVLVAVQFGNFWSSRHFRSSQKPQAGVIGNRQGSRLTLKTLAKESGSACAMPQADSTSKMRSAVRSTVSCG